MIDWSLLAKVVGGGFGLTIFVLVILSLDCTPMIGQIGLGESGGVSRYSPD